ncbi:response regulator transcription factor [Salinibacterium sp. dk2585]|uniref:response regulator n=1 Tax=unclassified Salinibacterium TaxID=2632331 RepID=UPI0011C25764|nr:MULTISPECIES: response regulator transcription factor [unclassified Salinibacterium]QEE61999.1 response regulator transcription factor [Salinibacterium sp. dk2585]TXK54446.1 response regulator transcription factor [Salinibacterium sp. dk5596]
MITVLLADDHAAIRSGLRLLLQNADDITVVGEAGDGATAISNARALRPDVVLMDIRMPGVDGIAATRAIRGEDLAEVLVLTTFGHDDVVFDALRAGAAGFLLKTVGGPQLIDAVRRVATGEGVLAPEVTRGLLDAFARTAEPEASATPAWLDTLTAREIDVLRGLAHGRSNAEIARDLHISTATAKTHVSRVLAKLSCSTRMQAAILAREAGLDTPAT